MTDAVIGIAIDPSGTSTGARVIKRNLDDVGRSGETNLNRIRKSTDGVTGALRTLQVALAAVFSSAILRQYVDMADRFSLLESRLRLVTSSSRELLAVQRDLFAMSQRTRTSYEATSELYMRVARSAGQLGASQAEMLRFTELTQQAIITSGASAQEASAGVLQLGQALASGTLRGDELRSVLENLNGFAIELAAGLGTTVGGLRALAEEGKLTSREVFEAILRRGAEIEARFQSMPRTIGQAMTQLNNDLFSVVGQVTTMGDATSNLTDTIDELREAINSPEFKGGLIVIRDVFAEIVEYFALGIQQLGALAELARNPSWENFARVIENAGKPLRELLEMLRGGGAAGGVASGIDDALNDALRGSNPFADGGGGGGGGGGADLKELTKDLQKLRYELVPLKKAQDDYASSLKTIEAAQKAGLIAEQEAVGLKGTLAETYEDLLDPYGAIITSLEREREMIALTDDEREIQIGLMEAEQALRERGVELNKQQRTSLEALLRTIGQENSAKERLARQNRDLEREQSRLREEYERMAAEPFKNALESIQRTFADTFEDIFSGGVRTFGDLADSIKRIMTRLAAELVTLQFFGPQGLNIAGMLGGAGGMGSIAGSASGGGGILGLLNNGLSIGKLFAGGGLANLGSNFAAGGIGGALFGLAPAATALGGGATATGLGVSAVAGGATNAGIVGAGSAGLLGSGGSIGALGIGGLAIGAVLLASQLFSKKPSDFTASFQGMLDGDLQTSEDKANDQTRQMRDQIQTATESALQAVLGGLGLDTPGGTYLDVAAGSRDGLRFWLYDTMDDYFGQPANVRSDPIASGQFGTVEDLIAGVLSAVIERAGTEGLDTALRAVAENADFSDLETALADIELAKFYDGLGRTIEATAEADAAIAEINARFDELAEFAERFGLAVDKVDTGRADAFADLAEGFTSGLRDQILALTDPAQLAVRELEAWRDAQIRNANAIAQANGLTSASTEDLALILELFGLKLEEISGGVGDALNYITAAQANVFNEQLRAVESYLSEVERNNAAWRRLGDQMRQTRQGLLLDTNLSPLSSSDRLSEASRQFEDIAARARLGDQDAIAELPDISRAYLEASRDYYASSEQYYADFNRVQAVLADTEALTGRHLSIGDQQLAAARDQVEKLNALINGDQLIVSSIEQANGLLAGIYAQLQAAGVPGAGGSGVGTGSLGTGVSYVDTGYQRSTDDVINGLTRTELDRVRASVGLTTAGGGVIQAQIAQDPDLAQRYRDAILAAGGVPSFASGGWHSGGLARVHNDELIYTGPPARIFNAAESQRMIGGGGTANDNGDVVSAIRDGNRLAATGMASLAKQVAALTEEMREVKQELGDRRAGRRKGEYAA